MKRFALIFAILAPLAGADVLWRGDFETGDRKQWPSALNENGPHGQNITIVNSPVAQGKFAARVTVHPDDLFPNGHNRVELHYDCPRTGEGGVTWFSWRFQIPTNVAVHEDIGYWETAGPEYRQSMAFYVDPREGGSSIGFRTNLPAAAEHWKADLTAGVWHQIAMKVSWSEDPALGRVSVWFDGAAVVKEITAKTKPNKAPLFIQVGFHRDESRPATESIFIDDAVEATTLEDLLGAQKSRAGQ